MVCKFFKQIIPEQRPEVCVCIFTHAKKKSVIEIKSQRFESGEKIT